MKFHSKTLITLLVLAVTAAMTLTALAEFGSGAVTEGQTYTTEEMLTYAIQDEYMALAEYEAIVAAYGDSNPFSNLIEAEEYHIALLTGLFETYGYTVPINDASSWVALPNSLDNAYEVGAEAEINNIAMYESFLAQDVPDDLASVFSALKDASGNHLSAFDQAGDRPGFYGMNANERENANGNARDDANGRQNGSCMDNGARNGGSRDSFRARGEAGQNRDNCPVYTDDSNP